MCSLIINQLIEKLFPKWRVQMGREIDEMVIIFSGNVCVFPVNFLINIFNLFVIK